MPIKVSRPVSDRLRIAAMVDIGYDDELRPERIQAKRSSPAASLSCRALRMQRPGAVCALQPPRVPSFGRAASEPVDEPRSGSLGFTYRRYGGARRALSNGASPAYFLRRSDMGNILRMKIERHHSQPRLSASVGYGDPSYQGKPPGKQR